MLYLTSNLSREYRMRVAAKMGHYEVTSLSRSLNLVINTFKYVKYLPKWAILNNRSTKNEIINILGCARRYFPMCPNQILICKCLYVFHHFKTFPSILYLIYFTFIVQNWVWSNSFKLFRSSKFLQNEKNS